MFNEHMSQKFQTVIWAGVRHFAAGAANTGVYMGSILRKSGPSIGGPYVPPPSLQKPIRWSSSLLAGPVCVVTPWLVVEYFLGGGGARAYAAAQASHNSQILHSSLTYNTATTSSLLRLGWSHCRRSKQGLRLIIALTGLVDGGFTAGFCRL